MPRSLVNHPDPAPVIADAPLVIRVGCPICGELINIDQYLLERACGHVVQASRYGGTNAAYSLDGMARGLSQFLGHPLEPKPVPALEAAHGR